MMVFFLLSCVEAPSELVQQPADVAEIQAQVSAAKVGEGEAIELQVVVQHAADLTEIGIAPPQAAGMTISLQSGPEQSQLGTQLRQQWAYSLSAPPGSYVIYPGAIQIAEDEPIGAEAIFVDVAVQGPVSELSELVLPPEPPPETTWSWALGIGGGALGLIILGFGLYRWRHSGVIQLDPVQVAKTAWADLQQSPDEHARAVGMSQIVRQFIADITHNPSVMTLSPNELQDWLVSPPSVVTHPTELAQLLLALDAFKFSRIGGGDAWWGEQQARFDRAIVVPVESV